MYFANILLRHTVADAAGSAVWAMHVPATSRKALILKRILPRIGFDGTAAAAHVGYDFWRFTGADPTTGTTVPRIKGKSTYPNSVIADANIQQKSGVLTLTGVVFEAGPFAALIIPVGMTGIEGSENLAFSEDEPKALHLKPGEGLAIRVAAGFAAVIGQSLSGFVEWDERDTG